MSARVSEIVLSFLTTFALGVGVSLLVLRLWYRYVVGACVTDWKLAGVLGLIVAVSITALEVLTARAARETRVSDGGG